MKQQGVISRTIFRQFLATATLNLNDNKNKVDFLEIMQEYVKMK